MSAVTNSTTFFQNGNAAQFEFALALYPAALKVKAENRGAGKKPEKLIRLDDWYQHTLPKLIAKRGKDAHLLHEELCQTMEWKQNRGKSYPQLTHLIKINTPRAVMVETKKAFRKLPNLESALNALSNLKGVGITMASALLAAAVPDLAPFMADECLNAMPEFENIDYTAKEYLKFVELVQAKQERLNKECGEGGKSNGAAAGGGGEENGEKVEATATKKWTAHSVELALWAYSVAFDLQPELLKDMPESNGVVAAATPLVAAATNGNAAADTEDETSQNGVPSDESNLDSESASKDALITNGNSLDSESGTNQEDAVTSGDAAIGAGRPIPSDSLDDCAKSGDSLDGPPTATVEATAAAVATLCTADSNEIATADAAAAADSDSQSSNSQKRPLYCDENSEEQPELSAPKLIKL
uniref:Uncharacterized protein n=1 Tax=Culex tarsalis TaxID=7177 RepID=A0A1Q3EVN4_CULTA